MIVVRFLVIISLFFIISCNSNKTEEEMEELWEKAQTKEMIIRRSGTIYRTDMDLAMRDAETRLQSGGGLLGKGGLSLGGILNREGEQSLLQ